MTFSILDARFILYLQEAIRASELSTKNLILRALCFVLVVQLGGRIGKVLPMPLTVTRDMCVICR